MTPATIENATATLSLGESAVRRNIVSTLAGNLVFSGTQWLITVVIARLGGMSLVGQYALGLAVCVPIFAFTGLPLRAIQATDCGGAYRFTDYLAVRLAGTACALVAVTGLAWLMGWQGDTVLVVLAVAFAKAVESFSDVLYGLFQLRDRLDLIASAMSIRAGVGLVAVAVSMAVFRSAAVSLAALAAAWLAALLIYEWPIAVRIERGRHATPFQRPAAVKCVHLALLCLPLAFVLLLLGAGNSLPRVMLEHHSGHETLGVFSAVATMSGAIGLLYSSLGQTALPRLARMFASDREQFRFAMVRMIILATALSLAVLAGAWCCGVRLVAAIYGTQSAVTRELVTGLVAVGVLSNTSSLLGLGLTASRRFWSQLVPALMILLVVAGASVWLIPRWGARGAMYAGLVGACFQVISYGYMCWREPRSTDANVFAS